MVLKGQYLERSVAVKSGEIALDGLYHRGRKAPPCVLAPPHPVLGGSKWDLLVSALSSFVGDASSAGIGVGIQYFGLNAIDVAGIGVRDSFE